MRKPSKISEAGALARLARAHNDLLDYIECLQPLKSPAYMLRWTAKGWTIDFETTKRQEGTTDIKAYKLHTVGADTVTGMLWDGTAESGDLLDIMKPYLLRKTPFDGKTISYRLEFPTETRALKYTYLSNSYRTASRLGFTENQQIIPLYTVGDIIYVAGITGTGDAFPLLDLNVDGRAWARV